MQYKDFMATSKRADPSFAQVSGYIKKEIALKFKATCTMTETSQSEAMEEALLMWLAQKKASL
ncbi:MAG: hypothetical protein WBA43_22495 [Elainellaceae cyanobacterium]